MPFKSAAAAYPDAITGTITMLIDSLPSAMQHLKAGTMRPLAMLSAARDPAMPDVPTIAEAGFPEAVLVFWSGLHGPAGMPGPVAYLVYVGEVLAPLLVILGLWTRPAALVIAINMIFAVGLAHLDQLGSLGKTGGWALELQGMYFFSALALSLIGAGRFSVGGTRGRFN